MSEKTRSIKTKDVTDVEAREYLLQISAHLNEIARLEAEKADINKSLNAQIKVEEGKLESLRVLLNDGVVVTVHNFMDSKNHEIIWKDEDGNEVDRTPFDDEDWIIFNNESQRSLFRDYVQPTTGPLPPELPAPEENIIDAEAEEMPQEDFPEGNDPDNLVGIIDKYPEEEPENG